MQVKFINYIEISECFTLYLNSGIPFTFFAEGILYSLLKTYISIISCMYTSILFSFFLLIYCVGPNVIETSVARTDLNNSLKVRVTKYCWIIWMALFDVGNVKHFSPSPQSFWIFKLLLQNVLVVLSSLKLIMQYCTTTVLLHQ